MNALKRNFLLLVSFVALSFTVTKGQSKDVKIMYSDSAELLVNEHVISGQTTVKELGELFGKASEIKERPNGDKSYYFNDLGIVISVRKGLVAGLGINFNWDGDKKFPEASYTGSLKVGNSEINKATKSEAIAGITTVKFVCPFPSLCASSNREANVRCTAAFKESKLTQVVFLIK